MGEEWRSIPEYEDHYWVSNRGRVKSLKGVKPRILKFGYQHKYAVVSLSKDSRVWTVRVHRLVADAFLGRCPDGMEILHSDGDSCNNIVENLRYGTRSENNNDAVIHGTHSNTAKTHCPQGHPYDEDNTKQYRIWRRCKTCIDEWNRKRYE